MVKKRQALITGVSCQYRSATLLASAPGQKSDSNANAVVYPTLSYSV